MDGLDIVKLMLGIIGFFITCCVFVFAFWFSIKNIKDGDWLGGLLFLVFTITGLLTVILIVFS